jgi:hypothetical protein
MLETASRQALYWRHTARPARCGMLPWRHIGYRSDYPGEDEHTASHDVPPPTRKYPVRAWGLTMSGLPSDLEGDILHDRQARLYPAQPDE